MEDKCGNMRLEWPINEVYVKEEPVDSTDNFPSSLQDEESKQVAASLFEQPLMSNSNLFQNECCDGALSSKSYDFNAKKDNAEESGEIDRSCSPVSEHRPILITQFNENLNIGTEEAETTDVNPVHTGEKLHECQQCNKKFGRKALLQRHILAHTGERRHECRYCHKKFTYRGHLQRHILIHTGEKSHECHYCNKKFSQKWDLQIHFLTHTGERPHECHYCNKKFSYKGHLQRHLVTHTGERPYECEHCNKKFIQKGHLQRHLLIHSGERPHDCLHCNKKFTRKGHLQRHIVTHHNESQINSNIIIRNLLKNLPCNDPF